MRAVAFIGRGKEHCVRRSHAPCASARVRKHLSEGRFGPRTACPAGRSKKGHGQAVQGHARMPVKHRSRMMLAGHSTHARGWMGSKSSTDGTGACLKSQGESQGPQNEFKSMG